MKLKLAIEDMHGQVTEVLIRPRTQIAFEREWSTPERPVRLDESVNMEQITWLAWHALRVDVPFDEWVDTIDDITPMIEEQDDDAGPLATAPPSGTSLRPPLNQGTVSLSIE